RAFWFDLADPVQRFVEIEMTRMRALAQRIDDPDVEAAQRGNAFGRQTFDVGRVGHVAEPEAEGRDVAMTLQDREGIYRSTLPVDRNCPARHKTPFDGDRRIFATRGRRETIAEAGIHGPRCRLIHIDVDPAALVHE